MSTKHISAASGAAPATRGEILNDLRAWFAATGAVPKGGSWEAEIESIVAGAFDTGRAAPAPPQLASIDMVLHCPACGLQHIDRDDSQELSIGGTIESGTVRIGWDNPPHRSHLCHGCGRIWRPADVPTNGVAAVSTAGKADSPIATPVRVAPAGWKLVPIEPTAEMMAAAWDHTPLHMYDMTDGDFGQAYKDMLAAAPVAPQDEKGEQA